MWVRELKAPSLLSSPLGISPSTFLKKKKRKEEKVKKEKEKRYISSRMKTDYGSR